MLMERKQLWGGFRRALARITDLGVATRLAALILILGLSYLFMTRYVIYTYEHSQTRLVQQYDFITHTADLVRTAQVSFETQVQEFKNMLLRGHDAAAREEYTASFKKEAREVEANLQDLKEKLTAQKLDPDRADKLLETHRGITDTYLKEYDARFEPKDPLSVRRVDAAVRDIDRQFADDLDVVVFDLLTQMQQYQETVAQEQAALALRFMILLIVVSAVTVLIGFLFSRSITKPLAETVKVLGAVAGGDLSQQLAVTSKSELGQMAETLNQTIVRLRGQVRTEAERDQERRTREELQENISRFLDTAMEIAHGDLTRRGEVTSDVLGNVVDAINLMVDEIALLLKGVREAANNVASNSGEMLASTEQMVVGVQAQTRDAINVSSAMEEMTISVRQVAENAEASAQAAQQTLQAADKGEAAVRETLASMQQIRSDVQLIAKRIKSLGDRSLEISEIVDTIDDIASQTNLLALNAAIEAAGAGEAGLRFAVVADEVRKLAERAAKATRDIAGLIKSVQTETQEAVVAMAEGSGKVEAGFHVAAQAEESLREIGSVSRRSADLAKDINFATQQQVRGAEGVATAVQSIGTVATQTEQGVLQSQQTVQAIARLAQELTASLSRFKLAS
jgi:twitching motility protein PilJ